MFDVNLEKHAVMYFEPGKLLSGYITVLGALLGLFPIVLSMGYAVSSVDIG